MVDETTDFAQIIEESTSRLEHFLMEYEQATSRSEKRRIENKILNVTCGQVESEPYVTLSEEELESLAAYIEPGDAGGDFLLRRLALEKM